MKTILTALVLATAPAIAQQAAVEPTLKAGSEVSLAPLAAAEWIQGAAPKSFEPGKVYIFECWATWCGPCVAAIPHMNELFKKYHDKGLQVYGMNVWEDGKDKVEKFVKDKGDGMSYPVAFTGKGSAFEKEWLKPAGVHGIPHAFVVKDGKLVLTSHPAQLSDSVIEALLSGDEAAEKAAAKINAAKEAGEKTGTLMREIRAAGAKNDAGTMAAKIGEFEKLDASSPYLPALKLDLLIVRKDWPGATKAIAEMPAGASKQMSVMMTASKVAAAPEDAYPADFTKTIATEFEKTLDGSKSPVNPLTLANLSMLQWKGGDKEAAAATARRAAETAANHPQGSKLPSGPFERFAKSATDGTMPTMSDLMGWLREGMTKAATATNTKDAPAGK